MLEISLYTNYRKSLCSTQGILCCFRSVSTITKKILVSASSTQALLQCYWLQFSCSRHRYRIALHLGSRLLMRCTCSSVASCLIALNLKNLLQPRGNCKYRSNPVEVSARIRLLCRLILKKLWKGQKENTVLSKPMKLPTCLKLNTGINKWCMSWEIDSILVTMVYQLFSENRI